MKTASMNSQSIAGSAGIEAPRPAVARRFGSTIDVRNRGALRLMRLVGQPAPLQDAPAVVRMWHGEQCRELSVRDARALAAQLLEAAMYAEQQNLA